MKPKRPLVEVVSTAPQRDARRLLATFLRRAFRRPVTDADVETYLAIFNKHLATGKHFQDALKAAYRAALISPDFLLLGEQDKNFNLAARLSYFLWSSLPDETLLQLADNGQIADSNVRRAQAERMLADPKAKRFVTEFCGQWLRLRDIDDTEPDKQLYPEFTPLLKRSMIPETHAYFHELLKHDLGIVHLVKSDFAMLNRPLAQHYGIPGVKSYAMQRVKLPADSVRGPFLAQASVLKLTANGTTTSPVIRGAFVMDKLLGITPTPPPPEAGTIEPDTRGATTIREQLAQHQRSASCAACHAKMDPYGFALENFDVIGEYRERYKARGPGSKNVVDGYGVKYHYEQPVDSSGKMPDGRPFHNYTELRNMLAADQQTLARAFVGHLVTFATGAAPSFADRANVDEILARSKASDYGVRTLIIETVSSPLFAKP